ncbi:MAG: MtnX-like HAD-IB family phosphatase [Anaerolineaceae bacterium]|nr:MAG: MtnX-like HAD-IB family phosphatase [Anaerolineaceae bacterium]
MEKLNGSIDPRKVVLCDFDGTLTDFIIINHLYETFAECGLEYAERWERGEISTMEEMEKTFATVTASREEMESEVAKVDLVPGVPEFISMCQERGYSFAVVSDGLHWYIDYILRQHGIAGIKIFASHIHFEPGGFRFSYPWYDPQIPLRSTSKPTIIRQHQEKGSKVAFIGDGTSDFEVVGVADLIYARKKLAEYCQSKGVPAIEFTDFYDLLTKWQGF